MDRCSEDWTRSKAEVGGQWTDARKSGCAVEQRTEDQKVRCSEAQRLRRSDARGKSPMHNFNIQALPILHVYVTNVVSVKNVINRFFLFTLQTFMMQMPKKTPGVSPRDEFGMNDNKYHNSSETLSVSSGSFISYTFSLLPPLSFSPDPFFPHTTAVHPSATLRE